MSDKLVTVSVVVCGFAATAWAALHGYLYGLSVPGLVVLPILYPVICLPLLGLKLALQHSVWPLPALILMHLLGVTLLPAFLMIELGGFASSGGVICWSSAGPFTALLLYLRPLFKYSFLALYFAVVVFAFAWTNHHPDGFLVDEGFVVEEWQVQLYACMTVFGVTLFSYSLLWVLQREVSVQAALHKRMIHSFMPAAVGRECLGLLIKQSYRTEIRNSVLKANNNRVWCLNSNGTTTPSPGQSRLVHDASSSLSESRSLKSQNSSSNLMLRSGLTRTHTSVTVVRCHLVGFMAMHQVLPAPAMLQFLDRIICSIDSHADSFGISKVSVSDGGYIAAAGLVAEFGVPQDAMHHAVRAVMFSLSVLSASKGWSWPDGSPVQFQIGLASGSLSSGLLGDSQSQYSVTGVVPCLAACMMQACLPGCIHLTSECCSLVQSSLASGPVATALCRKGSPLLQMETKTGVKLQSLEQEQTTTIIRLEENASIVEALPDIQECLEDSRLMYSASMKQRARVEVSGARAQIISSHHDQLTWLLEK